ncbi:hydroxymethylglutaryl-CoA synthase family protein [Saccharothrix coeruleofusca]|uniref:Hydroxymethylglutaryl-CoA synthase n=1 Tax=Saccharothrix coeruleofusca TaxID=33919 RepID=A0A918AWE2_9PSEU|nr:hydroxymethylglutaryl-CoA synthase family protein [Saccharothrix coeruleofusca]MBP2336638.1 polyketide biosynthesis 3-hydroxy-3-methylglutaryl-CoA synthase-like enzyme PksG [Saccharothrix coeruleofusca]GGP51552.1 hydroxymethylglutaryl-CoA synthase [Saccharothrix coeruleofusca]GGP84895.1 hydroxymethylglutaryl-CoA synthase [Saccharothrix coeruleofusca]
MSTAPIGIEALNVYCGLARIPVAALFAGRGLDPARLPNLMMDQKSVALPCEDPVTNAVNAAKPLLDRLDPVERASIELLVTSTESGVDYSKSVASYVHEQLGLSRRCRTIEVKQACYAATAGVQLAAAYVASGLSPGAKALVIGTDVSVVDERAEYTEPAMGTGAAAMLVGDRPRVLALDQGAFGLHSYETFDSARPGPTFDVADSDRSLFAYIDCLRGAFRDYADRVEEAGFAETFDLLAMHTPFAGIVRAAHRAVMRDVRPAPSRQEVETDFARRLEPSLRYPRLVGNLCSGSVYLALASLLDAADVEGGARVGLYSYGSGCASEFFSGVVDGESAAAVREARIGDHLAARFEVDFAEYTELLAGNARCLVPERDRPAEAARCAPLLSRFGIERELLVFNGTKGYHRQYEWTTAGAA